MDILIRVRVNSLTLARLVLYYQQNGVVPKSRNLLVNTVLTDHVKALERHELLRTIPEGRDIEILRAAGYIGAATEFGSTLSESALSISNPTAEPTGLAAQVAANVGRKK